MTSLVPIRAPGALTRSDARRLAMFKATTGKHLIGSEIDLAVEYGEMYGANLLTRDIYFFVFDADKPTRHVVPVLSIGLYRKIAARTGNYRPDENAPVFRYDESKKDLDNPTGLVSCEVTVYRFSHGSWFPVRSRLRWEERAPIILDGENGFTWEPILKADGSPELWPDDDPNPKRRGKPKNRKVPAGKVVKKLDPTKRNWFTMPETMLAKCTEADALRRGWPNETAGSYGEGELDAVDVPTLDLTATEVIDEEERRQRLERIGGDRIIVIAWEADGPLKVVPAGEFYDRAVEFITSKTKKGEEEYSEILAWRKRNEASLNQFWAYEKGAALDLKARLESVEKAARAATEE